MRCIGSSVPSCSTSSPRTLGFAFGYLGAIDDPAQRLRVDVFAAPDNLDCANAPALHDGDTLDVLGATVGQQTLGSVCLPESDWPPLFYEVTIPAGQTLTAVGSPLGSDRIALRLLDGCAPASCVAEAESFALQMSEGVGCDGPNGCTFPPPTRIDTYDPATLTWTNPGPTAVTLKLAAGINPNLPPSILTLHVEIRP